MRAGLSVELRELGNNFQFSVIPGIILSQTGTSSSVERSVRPARQLPEPESSELASRCVRDAETEGSIPSSPTNRRWQAGTHRPTLIIDNLGKIWVL